MLREELPIEMSILEWLSLHIHKFENYPSLFKGAQLTSSPRCQHIIDCFLFYLVLSKLDQALCTNLQFLSRKTRWSRIRLRLLTSLCFILGI